MSKHILIFDSGLGGTTILENIHQALPNCHYSYALDNEGFPYSNKSDAYLQQRITAIFTTLIPLVQPDLIVIACNTISTLALTHLRQQFQLPFVGVVPAIKPAAAISTTKVVALLATEATINRDYIEQLSSAHAENCTIIRFGSQRLVEIAEDAIEGKPINTNDIHNEVKRLQQEPRFNDIDTVILGCTHFPALKEALQSAWPKKIHWVDSGEAVARRVEHICHTLPEGKKPQTSTLYLTSLLNADLKLKTVEKFGIRKCHVIKISS